MRFVTLALLCAAAACSAPENPPITSEPTWHNSRTKELARRACFDCHSNETKWPIYSTWPFVGGIVQDDVKRARRELNFSAWDDSRFFPHIGDLVRSGAMPLGTYLAAHPLARLSDDEKEELAKGLDATMKRDPPGP